MDPVFAALGEPTRRRILLFLAGGQQPVGAVVTALRERGPISQPATSQHLKVLLDARLVTVEIDGPRRLYRIDPEGIAAARAWLAALVDPAAAFEGPLDALATEVARGRRDRRRAVDERRESGGGQQASAASA